MAPHKTLATPAKTAVSMHVTHLAKILFHLSIACAAVCLAGIISALLNIMVYLIGIMLIICTLGTILLFVPGFWDFMSGGGALTEVIMSFTAGAWTYIAPIGLICGVASAILFLFNKESRNTVIAVFSIIMAIVAVTVFVVMLGKG